VDVPSYDKLRDTQELNHLSIIVLSAMLILTGSWFLFLIAFPIAVRSCFILWHYYQFNSYKVLFIKERKTSNDTDIVHTFRRLSSDKKRWSVADDTQTKPIRKTSAVATKSKSVKKS
jgi:hypothetical protein